MLMLLMIGLSPIMLTSCLGDEEEEELIEEETTLDKYRKDIVGLWVEEGTKVYWRFNSDGQGSVATPSTGKNWDESEDLTEEEVEPFQWYIEKTGLMVIHSVGGVFNDPDPEAPFKIESLTSSQMTWKGSDGTYRHFVRK